MKIKLCIVFGLLFLTAKASSCQYDSTVVTGTDILFKSDEIINIELRSDFSAIMIDRVKDPQYHDGELIYSAADGQTRKLSVKIMARGEFRRDPANCSFPPIFVNFKKNEVKNTLFENQNKLKLVTPCRFDRDVIEEYLIYKMYNQVTDLSFKVRLVNILYFDTGQNKKIFKKYSFFIENEDRIAARINATRSMKLITPFDLDRENFKKVAVFQYMIGNKDWYVTSKKNIQIMQPKDSSLAPIAIPYDFDFAGFVDAIYTKPRGVPDEYLAERRVYKGLCYTTNEFNDVFTFYKKLKRVFEGIIKNASIIPKYNRDQDLFYLDKFYKIIEDPDLIQKEFVNGCEDKKNYNIIGKFYFTKDSCLIPVAF
jgi:hypothetical protein